MNNVTTVKFVEIDPTETAAYPDHIEIVVEENYDFLSACASYIGKIGGKQKWFMRPDCAFLEQSQVNHFAMYILGFGPSFSGSWWKYDERLMDNANYHFLLEQFHYSDWFDYRSVSNLLLYEFEDGSLSMPITSWYLEYFERDFPLSYDDVIKINSFYPLDNENQCLTGAHMCPAESSCRTTPKQSWWDDNYICDCPAGTLSIETWDSYVACVIPEEIFVFEWTNTTHFPGYNLRYPPRIELKDVYGNDFSNYDDKQQFFARVNF